MPRYIRHFHLNTRRRLDDSFASEFGEPVEVIAELIGRLDGTSSIALPAPLSAYSMRGDAPTRCMLVGLWTNDPPVELVHTIGVATRSKCGVPLWRRLWEGGGGVPALPWIAPAARRHYDYLSWRPTEPWVAARIERPALTRLCPQHLFGEFERCLAWALMTHLDRHPIDPGWYRS